MKLQWNKMNKETRETLGAFHIAVSELEDKKALFTKRLKNLRGVLDSTMTDLEKLAKGDNKGILKSEADLLADKAKFEKDLNDAKEAERILEDEIKARIKVAFALVPDTLHVAYENRVADMESYDAAIGAWLQSVGVTPTDAGVRILGATVGEREVHGKKFVKNPENMGLETMKFDPYARMFLKGVCREMISAGVLKTDAYKFEFVIETKKK